MQIEGLIPFKSSTDQAMTSLYFMRILISFCSFSFVKSAAMITGCALSSHKNIYLRCLDNSLRINPSELFSTSCPSLHCCLTFPHLFLLDWVLFL